MNSTIAEYQIDEKWQITRANDEFCRTFRSSESGLIGRDARELLRHDWRLDFRTYVVRALVGVGDRDVTLPMVAPCGQQGWYKHALEPILENGLLSGYRATVTPHIVQHAVPVAKGRWDRIAEAPRTVWDFDADINQPIAA
jgi:PAS domain-containing protein